VLNPCTHRLVHEHESRAQVARIGAGDLPPAFATTFPGSWQQPAYAFNTSLTLIGDYGNNSWFSTYAGNGSGIVNQRLYVDLGSTMVIGKVRMVNHHNLGNAEQNRGVRAARMYVMPTDPSTAFNTNVGSQYKVFDGEIQKNDYSNSGAAWQELPLSQVLQGRYFVCDFATNWGATDVMAVRRIQLGP
jgi:hypothetical protein